MILTFHPREGLFLCGDLKTFSETLYNFCNIRIREWSKKVMPQYKFSKKQNIINTVYQQISPYVDTLCEVIVNAGSTNAQGRKTLHNPLTGKVCLAGRTFYHNLVKNPGKLQVLHTCHKGEVCVNINHMYTGTPQNNADDMKAAGRKPRLTGDHASFKKLTSKQVIEIKQYLATGRITIKGLARKFNMSVGAIRHIQKGNYWKEVGPAQVTEPLLKLGVNSTNTSGYRGVSYSKRNKKWRATLVCEGQYHNLGYFPTALEAHQAYVSKLKQLKGISE